MLGIGGAGLLHAAVALAEPPSNVIFGNPGLLEKKAKPRAPDVAALAVVWPRLDPGAIVCRTDADLARLAANRTGGAGGGAAECQLIRTPTGITIIQRAGLGRTQVRLSGADGSVGWTDAWLPERAPR